MLADPITIFFALFLVALAQPGASPNRVAEAAPPAAPSASANPAPAGKLSGATAWRALIGKSVTGKTDDGTLTQYFLPDGKVKQLVNSAVSAGKWKLEKDKVCFQFTDEEDATCYDVEVDGKDVTFLEEDGSGLRYQLLQGNPKKL